MDESAARHCQVSYGAARGVGCERCGGIALVFNLYQLVADEAPVHVGVWGGCPACDPALFRPGRG